KRDADRNGEPERASAEASRSRGKEQAGSNREANEVEKQHLSGQSTDDPDDRAELLRLAFGKIVAQGSEYRPDRKDEECRRYAIGKGGRSDTGVACRPSHRIRVPGDEPAHPRQDSGDDQRRPIRATLCIMI